MRPALEFAADATKYTFQDNVETLMKNLQLNQWGATHFPTDPNKGASNIFGVRRGFQASKGGLQNPFSQTHGLNKKFGSSIRDSYAKGVKNKSLDRYDKGSSIQRDRYGVKFGDKRQTSYSGIKRGYQQLDKTKNK